MSVGGWRLEEVPDAAGEVAFEAADGFAVGLAFCAFAGDVGAGFGVAACAGDGDAVDGGVDLAVAAAVEAVAVGVAAELTGIGAMPPARASLASLEKRWAPAISPISLPAVSGPKPGSASSCGATCGDEIGDLVLERGRWSVRARACGAARRGRSGPARSARRAPDAERCGVVHFFDSNARCRAELCSGHRSCRCQSRSLIERGAHPDQPFAVIDQQPDVELDAGQLGDRQRVDAFAQRGAGDGERVDPVGLAALAAAAALAGHQPGRDPDDALAANEQEPLEGARDVPAVLQRPHPLVAQARAQSSAAANPRSPTATVLSPSSSPVAGDDRGDRVRAACACPHRARSSPSSLSRQLKADTSADKACLGRCHAPYLCCRVLGQGRWRAGAVRGRGR